MVPKLSPREKLVLGALCVLALALRLRVGIGATYILHPDETYDYLEQGFRLAFGYGQREWTYTDGIRSYLYPGIIAAVMKLGSWALTGPDSDLNAVAAFMALLSLSVVVAAFFLGRRAGGLLGAIVSGFIAAIWFELIYFSPHAMSEVMATNFLVIAVCLCPEKSGSVQSPWRWFWLGTCLGLAFTFRLQLAPAIAVVGLWLLLRHGWRVTFGTIAAAAMPVMATGMLDWITYSYPFESFFRYAWVNTAGGIASYFGRQPLFYLADLEIHYLGGVAALIAMACIIGGIELPLPFLVAAAILIVHTLISHKEYRFIYPAMPFIFLLAGVGTTRLIEILAVNQSPRQRAGIAAATMGLWAFTSWSQAINGPFRKEWLRESGMIAAARFIAEKPDVCGIAGYGLAMGGGGSVRFHHDVPVYWLSQPERFGDDLPSFNTVIAADDNLPPSDAFAKAACWDDGWNEASLNLRRPRICVLIRSGSCAPGATSDPDPLQSVLPKW